MAVNAPPHYAYLRLLRIRFLFRLLGHGPTVLIRLVLLQLKHESSWPAPIMSDLRCLFQACQEVYESLPDPDRPEAMFVALCHDIKGYKSILGKAAIKTRYSIEVVPKHVDLYSISPCPICNKIFPTLCTLRSHCCKVHKVFNSVRARVCTTTCLSCNT